MTIIENAAKEPHVVDLANFLNSMGANIKGAGTDVIRIRGVARLHGSEYTVIPDQIEAGTFMFAAAVTKGDVTVKNVIPKHLEATTAKLQAKHAQYEHFVFPGFYGTSANGHIQVFPRGGGDITGAILAKCLHADVYENWTDVSGFLMADPTIVKNPKGITHITYSELRELSYMGASVLHEEAIFPVKEANIPIHILNTNRPQDAGTIIQEHSKVKSGYPITGIAGKKDFMSIYVYKKHMSNEVGFIRKALSILEKYHISIEHIPSGIDSFNIVVEKKEIEESLYEILAHFKDELKPDKLTVQEDLALISTVGKNMSDKPGTSGKLFGALGKNNINIVMIAQGSDEINITVGVKKKDFTKTVQVIYDTFVGGNEE